MKYLNTSRTRPVILASLPNLDLYKAVFTMAIVPACKELNAYYELAVDGTKNSRLDRKVKIQIENSDIIIIDMTEPNLNTYGIAGWAKGIGKKIIFLHQYSKEVIVPCVGIPGLSINFPCYIYEEDYETLSDFLIKEIGSALTKPA